MDNLTVQVIVGYVMSFVLEWLKKASWFPLLTERSDKIVKLFFSGLVAACSAMAITYTWEPTAGVLTLSGITWSNVTSGLLTFLVSFITQHVVYEKLIKKEPL